MGDPNAKIKKEQRFINPPIKRHPTLVPLSREHFGGLVLVRRMREAIQADDPKARKAVADMIAKAWHEELEGHFGDEEKLLGDILKPSEKARLIEEHRSLERRARMAIRSEEAPSAAWLEETADMLEKHIRWEERELFPAAEKAGGAQLDARIDEAARMERQRPGSKRRQDQSGCHDSSSSAQS